MNSKRNRLMRDNELVPIRALPWPLAVCKAHSSGSNNMGTEPPDNVNLRPYPLLAQVQSERVTSMQQRVHVLIVDNEAHTRQGLQALLAAWPQIEVVGAAANGMQAVRLAEKCRPDVALIDIPMPAPAWSGAEGMDGLEAIRLFKSQWPQVRIVVLAMYATHRAAALAAGTDVFLLKGCPAQDLLDAIVDHWHPTGQA
jgi:CheY-like chemotaxis protein